MADGTVHLFAGYNDGGAVVVTSGITLCCSVHSFALPKGDGGTVSPEANTCIPLDSIGTQAGATQVVEPVDGEL